MNEELARRYAQALHETVGFEARMISFSKSQYLDAHPDRVPIFNANLCVEAGKVWHGDLDLTVDEPLLLDLAARIDETVYVLYESHGRFDNEEDPLIAQAVYSVTPSGHTRFDHRYIERAADGTLRSRPLPPRSRRRLRWRLLRHRPRLLRFWVIERKSRAYDAIERGRSMLVYIGARDGGATPLLVLGLVRGEHLRTLGFELTWYPSGGHGRAAPRELLKLTPSLELGRRLHLWMNVVAWPGSNYEFQASYQVRRRWR